MPFVALLQKRPTLAAALLLALAIGIPYWRLLTLQDVLITDDIALSDFANSEFPVRVELGRLLRSGQWSMWTETSFLGQEITSYDPFTLIFFLLCPPVLAVNACLLTILFWSAFGVFLYARDTKLSWPASVMAGVLFAHSGYLSCQLKHIGIIATVSWIPWCFLTLRNLLRASDARSRTRWASLLALCFGAQMLAGFPQNAYFAALSYALYSFVTLWGRRKESNAMRATIAPAVAFGTSASMVAGLIGAAGILPLWSMSNYADRTQQTTWAFATQFNFQIESLWTFLFPYHNGDISNNTYQLQGMPWEDYAYVGLLALLFGAYSVVRAIVDKRRLNIPVQPQHSEVRALCVVGAFAFVIGIGALTPIYRLFFLYLPGMGTFRFSQRFFCVLTFVLVVLAAHGWDALWQRRRTAKHSVLLALCAVVTLLDPVALNRRQNGFAAAETWMAPPTTVATARSQPHAVVYSVDATTLHGQAFAASPGWRTAAPYFALRPLLAPNLPAHWNVPALSGYSGISPQWSAWLLGPVGQFEQMWQLALTRRLPMALPVKVAQIHGVDFVLTHEENSALAALANEHSVRDGAHVYRLPVLTADAYLAEHAFPAAETLDAALRSQLRSSFVPGETVALHANAATLQSEMHRVARLPRDGAPPGRVEWLGRIESRHHLRVHTRGQWLVEVGTYTPDWRATIDGREANVYRANIRQRAVFVPSGTHDVVLQHRPKHTAIGLALTVLGLVIAIGMLRFSKMKAPVTNST